MSRNDVRVTFSGDARSLNNAITSSNKTIQAFGNKTIQTFNRIGQRAGSVTRGFPSFGELISGATIIGVGKSIIDFDAKLARLSIQAGLTTKDMFTLKDQLFQVADATHQSPADLLEGISQIVEKTGNFKFAIDSLKDMGTVSSATGAAMADIGATASNLNEKLGITKNELLSAFDILNEQGKYGAFTLQQMAGMGERLFTAAARFNVNGLDGLRKFGALIQVIRTGTGSAEQATTAIERTVADLISNADKIKKITGFSIFDDEKSKKQGRHVLKEFDVVIKEIITRTLGDTAILSEIFGDESIRAMEAFARPFRETGNFKALDEFIKKGGDGKSIMKDFGFWSQQTASKIRDLQTQLSKLANENLAEPINELNKALKFLNENPIWTKVGMLVTLLTLIKSLFGWSGVVVSGFVYAGKKQGDWLDKTFPNLSDYLGRKAGVGYKTSREAGYTLDQGPYYSTDTILAGMSGNSPGRAGHSSQPIIVNNNITIDDRGRIITETDKLNTKINTKLRRGYLFPSLYE